MSERPVGTGKDLGEGEQFLPASIAGERVSAPCAAHRHRRARDGMDGRLARRVAYGDTGIPEEGVTSGVEDEIAVLRIWRGLASLERWRCEHRRWPQLIVTRDQRDERPINPVDCDDSFLW